MDTNLALIESMQSTMRVLQIVVDSLQEQVSTLTGAIKDLSESNLHLAQASQDSAASLRVLHDRIVSEQSILRGYATAKGDEALIRRLDELEAVRQAEIESGIPADTTAFKPADAAPFVLPFNPRPN